MTLCTECNTKTAVHEGMCFDCKSEDMELGMLQAQADNAANLVGAISPEEFNYISGEPSTPQIDPHK